jgi:LCP family protein required for cell wall assembly
LTLTGLEHSVSAVTSRVEETTLTAGVSPRVHPPRVQSRTAARTVSGTQRLLFVLALVTFGLASTYSSIALLARVTPALFPGKNLTNLSFIKPLASLDVPIVPGIKAPSDASVFNKRINLLILGVDKRPAFQFDDNGNSGYLTDTIMVATIDPVGKQASVLSFPRDMWVDIHTKDFTYEDRINTSFGVGVRAGKSIKSGTDQMELDMKEDFGIDIDYYVILDFAGVEKLIDALGGIDVVIPYDLSVPEWFYSDDDINGQWLSFPSGAQHLNGYNAVAFGRHREYDSDLKRVKRQQLVLKTALAKVFSMALLNDPFSLWDAYSGTVKTDIPRSKFPGYALLLKDTNGRLNTYSLGDPVNDVPTLTGFTTAGGAAVLAWNPENVQYWLSQVFTKSQYSSSAVEIQNGYGDDGQVRAAALGRYLAYSKGLPTVYYGPDQAAQPHTTITLYGSDRKPLAEDIAGWMGIPTSEIVVLPKEDSSLPDVVIVIGKDFKLPGG